MTILTMLNWLMMNKKSNSMTSYTSNIYGKQDVSTDCTVNYFQYIYDNSWVQSVTSNTPTMQKTIINNYRLDNRAEIRNLSILTYLAVSKNIYLNRLQIKMSWLIELHMCTIIVASSNTSETKFSNMRKVPYLYDTVSG